MDERTMIYDSIMMWLWMRYTGQDKLQFIEKVDENVTYLHDYCHCCEFYLTRNKLSCYYCPLSEKHLCGYGRWESAYSNWVAGIDPDYNAGLIIDALLEYWSEHFTGNEERYSKPVERLIGGYNGIINKT